MATMNAIPALAHNPYQPPISMGTTLLGVVFDGGVVIGADSRTSRGTYVANRVANKLTPITERIFVCRAGTAADTQALADIVRYQLGAYNMIYAAKPTVAIAAAKFRSMAYQYRDDLSASFLVAGWDEEEGGQIYAVPIGGMITRRNLAFSGSGSTFITGFLDKEYKENMTEEEAKQLILKG